MGRSLLPALALAAVVVAGSPAPVGAQTFTGVVGLLSRASATPPHAAVLSQPVPPQRPAPPSLDRRAAEIVAGYAGFLDESLIDHAIVGGTFQYRISRGVSIGPEIVYMAGPGTDGDLFLTGTVTFDFLMPRDGPRPGTINPFVVAGGGIMIHRSRFGGTAFSSSEGAVTGGGGARVWITERVYAMGAYRAGWEPHIRIDGGLCFAW